MVFTTSVSNMTHLQVCTRCSCEAGN